MTDYSVKVTVRNGRILRRMRECGIESQTELARLTGLSVTSINALVAMRQAGYNAKGEWREGAWLIADALNCDPHDLFNDQQREKAVERNSVEIEMSSDQVAQICADSVERDAWDKIEVDRLLEAVTSPRGQDIVVRRAQGETLAEIADDFDLSPERIRGIEMKALRQMRMRAIRQGDGKELIKGRSFSPSAFSL